MKGGNLFLGVVVIAFIWGVLGVIGGEVTWNDVIQTIFNDGPSGWGSTAILVMCGCWLGDVLIKTNIAGTIIKRTVELGGDKPAVTTILISIMVTLIFTSAFGAGVVVGLGVIVLPILLSLGIPKGLAVSSYVMSVGAGMQINFVSFSQLTGIFTDYAYDQTYLQYAYIITGVSIVLIIGMILFNLRKSNKVSTWAVTSGSMSSGADAPWYALITPFIPVLLIVILEMPGIPAFLLAVFYGLLTSKVARGGWSAFADIFSRTWNDGVCAAVPLLGFILFIQSFSKAAGLNSPYFQSVLGGVFPTSTLGLCILFAVLAPLALYRGPLSIFAGGVATHAVLYSLGFSNVLLFPLFYVTTNMMMVACCPTQSWNSWATGYVKCDTKDFLKCGAPWGWAICAVSAMVTYFMFG